MELWKRPPQDDEEEKGDGFEFGAAATNDFNGRTGVSGPEPCVNANATEGA